VVSFFVFSSLSGFAGEVAGAGLNLVLPAGGILFAVPQKESKMAFRGWPPLKTPLARSDGFHTRWCVR